MSAPAGDCKRPPSIPSPHSVNADSPRGTEEKRQNKKEAAPNGHWAEPRS
jgi:hypothetical protein